MELKIAVFCKELCFRRGEFNDITTVGDANVDPIEISGQVFELNLQPASGSTVRLKSYSGKLLITWTSRVPRERR